MAVRKPDLNGEFDRLEGLVNHERDLPDAEPQPVLGPE